jgi:hypothetical protein
MALAALLTSLVAPTAGASAQPARHHKVFTCGGQIGHAVDHPRNRAGATRLATRPVTFCPVMAGTPISQKYGTQSSSSPAGHGGIDFNGDTGDPIFAATAGTVTYATFNAGGFGNLIGITRRDGVQFWYAHLSRIVVSVGERVRAGEKIGLMGNTGASEGSHLHFEVAVGSGRGGYGTPTDPSIFLWGRPIGRHIGTAAKPPVWACAHWGC